MYGFLIKAGRIYFIGEREQQIDTLLTRHSIELRRLTLGGRCGQLYPVTSSDPFDIDACSRLIALVSRETYSRHHAYQPFEGLLAVPVDGGSAVDIYMQVIHFCLLKRSGIRWLHLMPLHFKGLKIRSKHTHTHYSATLAAAA